MFVNILKCKSSFTQRVIFPKKLCFKKFQSYKEMCFQTLKPKISSEVVLSKNNRENCINILKSMKHVGMKKKDIKKAAVLVSLCSVDGELCILYTVRAQNLKSNGGQVSFPGGMQDEQDLNLVETALRETFEEIGIYKNKIDVWGKGPEIYRSDVVVTPILGYIENFSISDLKSNISEVELVFPVPLNHLSSCQNFRTTQFRFGKTHVYKTPVYIGEFQRIWGLTAVITHLMLSALVPNFYNTGIKLDFISQRSIYRKMK